VLSAHLEVADEALGLARRVLITVTELAWLAAFSDCSSALLLGQKSGSAILLREKLLLIFLRWR
jgi:hypothetical protein